MLAMLGIRLYKNSAANRTEQVMYDACTYLTRQVRQCESTSQIRVALLGGNIPALVISSEPDTDKPSETWFFTYDDNLCRLNASPGETIDPEAGQAVMDIKSTDFHMLKDDLLEITVVTQTGESSAINLYLADNGGADDE